MLSKFSLTLTVDRHDPRTACEFLARHSGQSKRRIKDAMAKGAVWLQREQGKQHRIRRATLALRPGDVIGVYFDEKLLALKPLRPQCLSDQQRYSAWLKPAGMMTQGNRYGDHCSLLRQAELFFNSTREVFLVHRLDREASGVVLIAHDKEAAGKLSQLFQDRQIVKHYRALVRGNPAQDSPTAEIDIPLDGNSAVTEFTAVRYDPKSNTSWVDVMTRTGRKHQIRRHFEMIGCPLMGDPRYGQGNKNTAGMTLTATTLEFHCPFSDKAVVFKCF